MNKNVLNYRLCYIDDFGDFNTAYELYFTDNFENQWGDDWNDRPANCNAGTPYTHDGNKIETIIITCPYNEFIFGGKIYSVEDMNNKKATWLLSQAGLSIEGGDTLLEVLNKLRMIEDVNVFIRHEGDVK